MDRKQKVLAVIILMVVFLTGTVAGFFLRPVLADNYDVTIELNGKELTSYPDQKPFIDEISNRVYLPARNIAESLGAKVDWDQARNTVFISEPGSQDTITMQPGSKVVKMNGMDMATPLDAPPRIMLGTKRTVVPLRFISENMGYNVLWDGENRIVRISDKPFMATKELTAEQKARLMAYPYPKDAQGKTYEIVLKMVQAKEYFKSHPRQGLPDDILEYMMQPIQQKALLKANQRIITDADLCYGSMIPESGNRIRGILQTYNPDGSAIEQDIEYGFGYGAEFVRDGQPIQGSHWFDKYDTVQLSKAKKVQ